jgi:hypothetical protein
VGCITSTERRRILGVLSSLAKKYGAATVNNACAAALEMGVCDYRFVRRSLEDEDFQSKFSRAGQFE